MYCILKITLVEKSTNLEKGTIQLKSSVTDRTENDDTLTPVENIVRIKSGNFLVIF